MLNVFGTWSVFNNNLLPLYYWRKAAVIGYVIKFKKHYHHIAVL